MPYIIRKLPNQNLYRVYNSETKEIHSYGTTKENAEKQVKLLNMIHSNVSLKKGGSIETDKFDENGIVSLPEFSSIKLYLPTYMFKRQPDTKNGNKPKYRYKLQIPISSSRNLSSRKKEPSVNIKQKSISKPEFSINQNIELPTINQFSPKDREKIKEYYNHVKEYEQNNIKKKGRPTKYLTEVEKIQALKKQKYESNLKRRLEKKEQKQKQGNGLFENNKIFSNNKKMTNPWISYVKEYASKNKMSYRDALRDPNCKCGYTKKDCKVGKGVVDELDDQVRLAIKYNDSELGANGGRKFISL
jgi:5-methylcytosine-specific restriction endonuclease McrA